MTVSLRNALSRSTAVLALSACLSSPALAAHTGYTVGAIRWDPWYEPSYGSERAAMEASLGPAAWQGRAPSCATTSTGPSAISLANCGTQAQMDAEINAAAGAGLDYWAFCWYGPTNSQSPMSMGWQLYQSSAIKAKVKWSLLFASYTLFESTVSGSLSALTGYLAQSNYQFVTVSGTSRPLVYLLSDGTSTATLASSITSFRSAANAAGLSNPYIVLLGVGATSGRLAATGADAIGDYAYSTPATAGTYASLVTTVEARWPALYATGQSVVPTAMTGWDRRPRIERPVPWEAATQAPFVGENNYYAAGTPAQIATHLGDMLTWMKNNSSADPAATGLIYSWDEHDEGGSTLNPSLGGGSAILNAVGGAL